MRTLNLVALILVIVGALNWLLVGIADFNLVSAIFGIDSVLTNIIYILVGLAGIYCIYLVKVVMDASHRPVATRT